MGDSTGRNGNVHNFYNAGTAENCNVSQGSIHMMEPINKRINRNPSVQEFGMDSVRGKATSTKKRYVRNQTLEVEQSMMSSVSQFHNVPAE